MASTHAKVPDGAPYITEKNYYRSVLDLALVHNNVPRTELDLSLFQFYTEKRKEKQKKYWN